MSDIRITIPEDRSTLILKKIQNKIGSYKGYKPGGDARISSKALTDDIFGRAQVCVTNFSAAIENLDMYGKTEEKRIAEGVLEEIKKLAARNIEYPQGPVEIRQEDIQKFYLLDESGFKNSIDLLDNINSFRSATISGDFDSIVLEKIKTNIANLNKFLDEKVETFGNKN
ncbi:MAG: hypothetical protein QXL99_03245 [Thermoplasmatales archaeon]